MKASYNSRGQILYYAGLVNSFQINQGLEYQKQTGYKIGKCLVKLGFIKEDQMMLAMENHFGIPWLKINSAKIKDSVIRIIPNKIAELYKIVPVDKQGDILILAVSDPLPKDDINHLKIITGLEISFAFVTDEELGLLLREHYGIC